MPESKGIQRSAPAVPLALLASLAFAGVGSPGPAFDIGKRPPDGTAVAADHYLEKERRTTCIHCRQVFLRIEGRVKAIEVQPQGVRGWGICAVSTFTVAAAFKDGRPASTSYPRELLVWRNGRIAATFGEYSDKETVNEACKFLAA